MKVKITIDCDLSAFDEDDRASELKKIFNILVCGARHLGYEAINLGLSPKNKKVFDLNGNEVGLMEINKDNS